MTEILFRGKRADNGEWVYGHLLEQNTPDCHSYIVMSIIAELDNRHIEIMEFDINEVIPETVGQFTGLTDKNGKKIFEGDIVNVIYTSSLGEEFTQITTVRYDETECCFYPMRWEEDCVNCDYSTEITEIVVISNIHDNPELLTLV